jgi:chromosome segregation ATPase
MHLLMETAMVDSKAFQLLSFEEVEEMKRERLSLQNRIEATKRKLALEIKLRDAAQNLNRLYSPKGQRESEEMTADGSPKSPRRTRKSILGHRSTSSDVLSRTDDEFAASNRKCEELMQELKAMEQRLEEISRRVLEHTAGILQLTHKGLKKNVRGDNLPRSPESMVSVNHKSIGHLDGMDDFDDRSLYRALDHFDDHESPNRKAELQMLEQTEKQLDNVNNRLRGMVLQADPEQQIKLPPRRTSGKDTQPGAPQIQAHMEYLAQVLESMESAQARTIQDAQRSVYDSEDQMEDINLRLHDMLQKTNNVGQSPIVIPPDSRGKSLQSQLSFSTMVLDRLNQRVEHLVEQKDILSRQIQQQRELNSKSDAQRDAQIMDLTNELSNAKREHVVHEREAKSAADQIHLLMEQLDSARQESVLLDQKRQSEDRKLLEAERSAKRRAEDSLKQLQNTLRSEQNSRKQAEETLTKMQNTLQAGNDAQRQINENIAQLQGALQSEKDARRKADENLAQSQGLLQQEKDARHRADDTLTSLQETLQADKVAAREIEDQLSNVQGDLDEARIDKAQAEAEVEKCRKEIQELEGAVVRAQTDLTVVRAELDGAYGTRAQRAADVTMNPAVQKEIDDLNDKNTSLQNEINYIKSQGSNNSELQSKVDTLQKELKETIDDYEQMTKSSIEFERDREQLESAVDTLRERCEALEGQLSDERVKWLGMKSPGMHGPGSPETTSTMILKNEFKKMMRDTRAENMKALRVRDPFHLSVATLILG